MAETKGKNFQLGATLVGLLPVFLCLIDLRESVFAIQSDMPPFLFILLFCTLGILALPFILIVAWRLRIPWKIVFRGLLTTVVLTLLALATMIYLNSSLRDRAFKRAADHAEIVVDAIKRFERYEGHPPDSLKDLVPKYLAAIPKTSLQSYPEFEYERFQDSGGSLIWWDLGSRRGAPMQGLWVYPDGDPDHAILAFQLDGKGIVVDSRMDRLPDTIRGQALPFSKETWLAKQDQRLFMVGNLIDKHGFVDLHRSKVESLLGPPNGSRILRDSPWELRIQCSLGIMNWDVFFYWPTEHYPEEIYGGWVEKIGKWAYVHE
ncbi:MAG TPA: hypothetical protein VNL73_05910 [Verrucomicrobiae bacterium]|nr:hypothetical protein [Verrucomicrobiae bacterium]